jgi:hypothetical protein
MRESRTSGSVGRAPGNRGLYPEVLTSTVFVKLSYGSTTNIRSRYGIYIFEMKMA